MAAIGINTSMSMQHFSSNTVEAHMGGISIITWWIFECFEERILQSWFMFILYA